MATLPGTQFSRAEPSGRIGQTTWGAMPEGGGQQIAAAVSTFGQRVLEYALKVEKQKMFVEASRKKREIDERGWAAREAVSGDKDADKTLLEQLEIDINAIAGSSEWVDVNTEMQTYANDVLPNWKHGFTVESLNKQKDIARDDFNLNWRETLVVNPEESQKLLESAKILGIITEPEYDNYTKIAPAERLFVMAERFVAQNDYKMALATVAELDKLDLTTEQLKEKKTLAEYVKSQSDELSTKQIQSIHQMAIKNVSPDVVKAKIDQSDGLTSIQKTAAWKQYNDAMAVRAKTGQNPYSTTTDPVYFEQMKNDAIDGKMTEQRIRDAVGKHISSPDGDELRRIMKDGPTSKDFENSSAAKVLAELIKGPSDFFDEEKVIAREQGYRLLQEAIDSADPPMTDRQKKEKALEIFYNLNMKAGTITGFQTPSEKLLAGAEELGRSLDKAVGENIAYRKTQQKSATIPQPKTQAEFDALPKGARYRRSDGSIWTKR